MKTSQPRCLKLSVWVYIFYGPHCIKWWWWWKPRCVIRLSYHPHRWNKTIEYIRLRLMCTTRYPGESLSVYTLLASPLSGRLWGHMTSSTKPEIHNIVVRVRPSQSHSWCVGLKKIFRWSLDMWFLKHANGRMDRHTGMQYFAPPTGWEVMIASH